VKHDYSKGSGSGRGSRGGVEENENEMV